MNEISENIFKFLKNTIKESNRGSDRPIVKVLIILFGSVALLADAIIMRILWKSRLRKQRHSVYIFHISLLNIVNFCIINTLIDHQEEVHTVYTSDAWIHFLLDLINSCLCAEHVLSAIVTFDWFSSIYRNSLDVWLKRNSTTIIGGVYMYLVIVFVKYTFHQTTFSLCVLIVVIITTTLLYVGVLLAHMDGTHHVVLTVSLIRNGLYLFLLIFLIFGVHYDLFKNLLFLITSVVLLLLAILLPAIHVIVDPKYRALIHRALRF